MSRSTPPIALEDRDSKDGRLFSPSAGRNKAAIAQVLSECLPNTARVLEIGSGTGEHGTETLRLRPDLLWQFSDPNPESRASQAAWIAHEGYDVAKPLDLDASAPKWSAQFPKKFDAIFSANMIHIAPIEALEGLVLEGKKALAPKGQIFLYGPFLFGERSAASNLDFDASLKSRNPAWGVRELESVKHIFAKHGFNHLDLRDMPKNNFLISLSRH